MQTPTFSNVRSSPCVDMLLRGMGAEFTSRLLHWVLSSAEKMTRPIKINLVPFPGQLPYYGMARNPQRYVCGSLC